MRSAMLVLLDSQGHSVVGAEQQTLLLDSQQPALKTVAVQQKLLLDSQQLMLKTMAVQNEKIHGYPPFVGGNVAYKISVGMLRRIHPSVGYRFAIVPIDMVGVADILYVVQINNLGSVGQFSAQRLLPNTSNDAFWVHVLSRAVLSTIALLKDVDSGMWSLDLGHTDHSPLSRNLIVTVVARDKKKNHISALCGNFCGAISAMYAQTSEGQLAELGHPAIIRNQLNPITQVFGDMLHFSNEATVGVDHTRVVHINAEVASLEQVIIHVGRQGPNPHNQGKLTY
ncbi:uncharacterized protein [Aristolochia californica]|uniref:uncharacterized protein n=1 Tax=Aristolochia californica TaxID=171875 RepID=UPI0035DC667E